jgi:hemerythrin
MQTMKGMVILMYTMNPEYMIGLPFLDEQHQKIFSLMEDVQTLLKDENILYKYDELVKILEGLEEYALNHFDDEVAFMESIDYPRLQLHIAAHKGFTDKLSSFELDAETISLGTQDKIIMELMDYLTEWLQIHICDCDRKIAAFVNGTFVNE